MSEYRHFTGGRQCGSLLVTQLPSQGGPSCRSCHKMCLDTSSQQLYLLGHYLTPTARTEMQGEGAEPVPLPVSSRLAVFL